MLVLGGALHNRQLSRAVKVAEDQQRLLAEDNLKLVEDRHVEVEGQWRRAQANLEDRLQMVDDIMFHMDARLAKIPAAASVRLEFLDEAWKLNAKLQQEQPGDERVLRQAG